MKKLTTSVLAVVLTASFGIVSAQVAEGDTLRTTDIREVVVTGALGRQIRQDAVITSNKVVNTKEINQASSPNLAQALTGKVTGLQINNTNNSVNPSNRIVLRGPRSMFGDSQALIVIDGAISTLAIFQQLPPEVVESVNVIKGQQGSAIYGSQGSNGVIVVTTKKGSKASKMQFNLTSSIDITDIYKLPIIQRVYGQGIQDTSFDATDYNGTNWVPYENTSWGPAYSSALGGQVLPVGLPQRDGTFKMGSYSPTKDNIKKFFNNGITYQNGLSMNVGGDDSYAFLSVNRLENQFMVDGDELKRNTFFFKGGKQLDKLRIDGTFNLIDSNTSQTTANLYGQLLQTPSNINIRDFRNSSLGGNYTAYAYNPYWLRDNYRSDSNTTTFNGIVALNYDFNKNISLSYTGNMNTSSGVTEAYNNGYSVADDYVYTNTDSPLEGLSFLDFQTPVVSGYNKLLTKGWRYYGDLLLNFNYDLTDDIALKAFVGNNIQDTKQDNTQVGGTNLKIPGYYNINNVLSPTPFYNLDNSKLRQRSTAWYANADFSFKDYLFVNGTFRYEESSVLSIRPSYTDEYFNNGFAYYSFGASFIPTKAFTNLKGDVLNYLKIAASYTKTGNPVIAPYAADEVGAFPTGFPFGTLSSYLYNPNGVSNNIKPEFNKTVEGNIFIGLFKDRITLEGSAYQTDTDDLITRITYPSSSGIASLLGNIGKMRNRGFEAEIGLTPFRSSTFEWNLKGGYSQYRSTVLELADGQERVILTNAGSGIPASIAAVKGYSAPMIVGTSYQRDPNGNIIVGANGRPIVSNTQDILGQVNPDYILTFSTSVRYKSLTLSAVGDFRTGNSFISATKNLLGFTGGLEKSADFDRSQGYVVPNSVQLINGQYVANTTPVNNSASYAGVTNYFTSNYQTDIAEEFVVDGTALKIREIALTYSLPKSILSNTFVTNLSIGVYARNPFVVYAKSNRNFGDPEATSTTGLGGGFQAVSQYPTSRSFGMNLNVNF